VDGTVDGFQIFFFRFRKNEFLVFNWNLCELHQTNTFEKSLHMKTSNFLLVLIFSPLALVAQSKKEEIILLNNRIDSLTTVFNLEKKSLQEELSKTKEDFKTEKNQLRVNAQRRYVLRNGIDAIRIGGDEKTHKININLILILHFHPSIFDI